MSEPATVQPLDLEATAAPAGPSLVLRNPDGSPMWLTRHFALHELNRSARFPHLATGVPRAVIPALTTVCEAVAQPWRDVVGRLRCTSGYRSRALNDALRGSRTSQHLAGEALDLVPLAVSLAEAWAALWALAALGLVRAGQCILYPADGFVHVATPSARYPVATLCVRHPARMTGYPEARSWAECQRYAPLLDGIDDPRAVLERLAPPALQPPITVTGSAPDGAAPAVG